MLRTLCFLSLVVVVGFAGSAVSADSDPKAVADAAVKAVGGSDKLLKIFRMKERLAVSGDLKAKQNERVSVLQPPTYWWVGKKERVSEEKEPATFLVWAWTLGAIVDPKSKLESIPDIKEGDKALVGIRVSETITPPMDMYFDKTDHRLVRIDWRSDIHRFSNWKEHDGVKYPARCEGFKKAKGNLWYFTDITEIERLKEVPPGLLKK